MPRMLVIVAVREAEAWSATNIVMGLILLAVAVTVLVWAIRRYLSD